VIERALEAFFRHALLIVLPVVVIPLDVTAWVFSTPPQYEAQAGVWVERPTYLNFTGDELTRYLPPATVQRNRLMELMRTRSFIAAVVAGTPLQPLVSDQSGAVALDQLFSRDFEVVQTGDHLLILQFRSEQQDVALQILNAVVAEFRKRASDDRKAQAQVAIAFYQTRLTDADSLLSQARSELAKYLAANPSIARTLAQNGIEVARLDPGFADLQRRVDGASRDSDSARSYLQAAQLDYSAGVQTDTLAFRIVDESGVSATPSRQLRKVLAYPIVALLIGFSLSAALLLLLTLSDHSVRSLSDLAPDTVILGIMPTLRPPNAPRGAGGHLTRRAIGFVAGAVPALRPPDRRAS
jgi:uncharacterized protein involved in exopolysaccharide biosynthesis